MNKFLILPSILVYTLSSFSSGHDYYEGRPRQAIKKAPAHAADKEFLSMELGLEKMKLSSKGGFPHSHVLSDRGKDWSSADLAEIKRQAKAGNTFRQFQMGQANEHGFGGFHIDLGAAERWYQMALDNGDDRVLESLDRVRSKMTHTASSKRSSHSMGWSIPDRGKDWSSADLAEIKRQAKAGNTFRQFQMGQANEHGFGGFHIDLGAAERWYQMALDNGDDRVLESLDRVRAKMGY